MSRGMGAYSYINKNNAQTSYHELTAVSYKVNKETCAKTRNKCIHTYTDKKLYK